MTRQPVRLATLAIGAAMLPCGAAMGAAHSWDIVEIFSSPDGTIQFIELMEAGGNGNETHLNGLWVASDATGNQFDFPGDLDCKDCTAGASLLLATAGFAALDGAPTPDYIITDGFFSIDGDTLDYYFYDTFVFTGDELPLDGFNSLNGDGSTGPNTPRNFAGETGTVNLCPEDLDHSGGVGTADLLALLAAWGTDPGGPPDFDGSGSVGTADLLQLLAAWGPCFE